MEKKWLLIGTMTLLFVAFLAWLFIESSKPLPGEKIADLGRGHVSAGEEVQYNSNPPTSGKHYEDWVRGGVYQTPRDDRNLVHSLEHGYVIMSYNCDKKGTGYRVQGTGYAQESSPSAGESTPSATLSEEFKSKDCLKLVEQLTSVYNNKGKHKLIIIPRPNLDTKIALTAWNYLDKFDNFDASRIEKFIDAHFDQGPEHTMEP